MNNLKTLKGIVISRRDVGESSCFVDVLTEELGVIELSARGAKKLCAKNLCSTALFSYASFCFSEKGMNYYLNSTEPIYLYQGLSADIEKLSLASYFGELVKYCTASEENQGEILRLFLITLYQIEKGEIPLEQIKAVFELRLVSAIGFMPELGGCVGCGSAENEGACFAPLLGGVLCRKCEKSNTAVDAINITPAVLKSMRFVAYSPLQKIYSFKLGGESLSLLAKITEMFLLTQVGRSFRTLDYYKNIVIK